MKTDRNQRLSEHLLNVDEELLANAYEIDDAEKLKAYKKTKSAPVTLLHRRSVWMPVAAAAACVALAVGLWQGGVFAPAQLPVEPPTESSTTEVTASTDTDVVTDPTDTTTKEPDADTTTDGTADTTTDTKQPDQTETTETKNPTATDKTDPTKTEKPTPSVTGGTDKTEPTKNTTTGKDKPTTKPTTKTEPTKTAATTEKKWPVIVADKPSIPADEYPDSVCPLLKMKMEQYKGVDVKYSVIVEVYYPNLSRDGKAFWQSNEKLAEIHKEYYTLNDASIEEAKRISPDDPYEPFVSEELWSEEFRSILEQMNTLNAEMIALEEKYFDAFATNLWNQRLDTLSKIAGAKLVPISTDSKYVTHVARNTNEAFFVELTAEQIEALEKNGGFFMRLKYPGGDWGCIDL